MFTFEDEFFQFISDDCDRKAFIQNFLNSAGLECPVVQIDGKNHLYVKFPKSQYNPIFKIKTVIAHYDRVPESPGANDNSSSVYALLLFAVRLAKRSQIHNIRLIFTDGEELGEGGVASQGAYGLARLFKNLGITNDDVYVFDCMGRGNIPVLTETHLPPGTSSVFVKNFSALEERAEKVLRKCTGGKWFKLPCNYSDNAGFIANGIPAVAFTMLPSAEVDGFMLKGEKPKTWQLLHTMEDDLRSLNEEAFEITERILDEIAELRTVEKS